MGRPAGRRSPEAVDGRAAREDLPVLRLAGQAPGQASTGERQGVDASLDGTTLAYITNAGDIDIWDLTRLQRRATFRAADVDGAAEQVGLSARRHQPGHRRLPRVVCPRGDPVPAALTTFDLVGTRPVRRSSDVVSLRSASSVAFGPDQDTVAVMEEEGSLVVVQGHGPDLVQTALGDACRRAMPPAWSPPSRRTGGGRARSAPRSCRSTRSIRRRRWPRCPSPFDQSERPLQSLQDPPGSGHGCLPEPCGGSSSSFGAAAVGGSFHCDEADGTDVTTADGPSLVSMAYSGLLTVPQVANVYGWRVAPSEAVPAPPLALVSPAAPVAAALLGGSTNQAGLMNVRLVRAGVGVGLLFLDSDGILRLWSASNGSLPTASRYEAAGADGTDLLAVAGRPGRAGALALEIDAAAPGAPARLLDMASGAEVGRWDGSPAPGLPDAQGLPIALRERADGAILEVLDDGTVLARRACPARRRSSRRFVSRDRWPSTRWT